MSETPILTAKGIGATLTLFEDKIRISRRGIASALTHGLQGDKDILLQSISSIQFKKAGLTTRGYIQFAFLGGSEAKRGLFQAARDENTVLFARGGEHDFERLRDEIQSRIGTSPGGGSSSLLDLEKLAELRDKGIVTNEEFDAKKRQILGL